MGCLIYCSYFKAQMLCEECDLELRCPIQNQFKKVEDVGWDNWEANRQKSNKNRFGDDGINSY